MELTPDQRAEITVLGWDTHVLDRLQRLKDQGTEALQGGANTGLIEKSKLPDRNRPHSASATPDPEVPR